MSRKNMYEIILEKYKEDIEQWQIFLYENMSLLMRKNPLIKHRNYTFTPEDIFSEAFLIADSLIQRDIPDNKKISKLWYLFNKWWWVLYNKLNQYSSESYTLDDIWESENWSYYMDDNMLEYVLVINNVINPMEAQILRYLWEGRWLYEISRLMKTQYYNIRDIVNAMTAKIEKFYIENNIDADNS